MASCRSLQIPPSHSSDAEIFLEEVTSQFLTCRLCKNPYKRPPKSLHCLHAFCGSCLERFQDAASPPVSINWTSKSRYVQPYRSHSSRTIVCPVCSRTTELPPGGVCRLPDNLLLEQLGQVVQRLRENSRAESCDDRDVSTVAPLCDVCRSSRGRTSVIMSCLQDNKNKITAAKQIGGCRKSSKRGNSTRKVENDDSDSNSSSPNERRRRFNDPVSESSCSLSFRNSWAILSKKQKRGQDSIDDNFDDDDRGSSQSVEEGKAEGFSYDHSRCSSSSGVSEISDDIAQSSTEAPAAVAKCIDCNKLLCEGCKQHHRQLSVTSSHSLVDVDCCNDVSCKTHHGEPLRYYCQACRLCICLLCTLNEHHAHDVISLQDGVSIHRLSLVELAERCRDRRDYLRHYLDQIEGAELERDECMAAVHRSANMAVSALREKEEAMIGEIGNVYGPDLQSVIGERSALLDDLKTLENICRLADMILDNNSVELLLMKDEMDSKCRSLLEKQLRELPESLKNPNRNSFKFINEDGLVMFSDVFTSEVATLDASIETDMKSECTEEAPLGRNIGTSSTQTEFWLNQEPYQISDIIMDTDFMIEVLEDDVTDSLSSFQANKGSNFTDENLITNTLSLRKDHYVMDEPGLIVIVADVDVDIPLETFYLVTDMKLGSNCHTDQLSNICAKCFADLEKNLNYDHDDSAVEQFSEHCDSSNKSESKSVIAEEVKSEPEKDKKPVTNVIICIQDDTTPIQCFDVHPAEIPTTFYFPAKDKDIKSDVTLDSSTQTSDSKSTQKCNNKNMVSGEDLIKKLDNEIELNCSRKAIQNILLKGQYSDTERCSSLPSELNIISLMSHRETFLKNCREILEQSESSLRNTYSKSTSNKSKATGVSALQLDCNRTDMKNSETDTSSNCSTGQSTDHVAFENQNDDKVSSEILTEKTVSNIIFPVTYCDVTTSTDISTKDAATFTCISTSNAQTATEIKTSNKDTSTDFKTSDAAVSTEFITIDASSSTDVTNSDATTLTDVIITSNTGCGDGDISCKSAGVCTDAAETKSVAVGEKNVVYKDTCTEAVKIEMVDSGCGEKCVVLVFKDVSTETVLESIDASCKRNEQAASDRNIDFQKEDINKVSDNLDDNLAQRIINSNKACGNLDDNLIQRIQYVAENNDALEDQTDTSILFIPEISVITPEAALENCVVKLKENALQETSIENKINPLNNSLLQETLQEALQEDINHTTNSVETNICSTSETGKSSSIERSHAESDHVFTKRNSSEDSLDEREEKENRLQTDSEDEDTNSEAEEFTSCLALNVNVEEKSRGPSENICSKIRNQTCDEINSNTEVNNSVQLSTSDNDNNKTEVSEKLQIKNAKTELNLNNVRQDTSTDTFSANGMSGSYSDLGSILLTSLPSFLALADRTFSASTSDIPSEKNGKHCYLLTGLRPVKSDECLNVEFRRRRGILLSEKSLSRTTVSGKPSKERESSSREYLSPSLEPASIKDCDRNSLPIVLLSDESVNGLENLPVLEIDEIFHSVLSLNGNDENNCNDNFIVNNLEEITNENKSELNKTDVTIRKCLQKPKLFIGALFELLSGTPSRDARDFNNIKENQKIETGDQKSDETFRNFHVPCEKKKSTTHNSTTERDIINGVSQDDYNLGHSNESNINLLEKYSKISHTLSLPNSPMIPQKKRETKDNYSDDYQLDSRGNKSTDTSKSLLSRFTAPKFSVQVHKLSILKRLDSFEHKQ